jgi:ribosomal protein RSM22 (predicted rRNA methylase)
MFHNEQSLIARKMILESKWNQMFLERGSETIDMMKIELELKEIKNQLRRQSEFKVREELQEEDLDIAS